MCACVYRDEDSICIKCKDAYQMMDSTKKEGKVTFDDAFNLLYDYYDIPCTLMGQDLESCKLIREDGETTTAVNQVVIFCILF